MTASRFVSSKVPFKRVRITQGAEMHIGYCTNVHAGHDFDSVRDNLTRFALSVKQSVRPAEPMGIGIWFSHRSLQEVLSGDLCLELRDWLAHHELVPFTINAFPFDDFHMPVVKHRVYRPTWQSVSRLEYTLGTIDLLHAILPAGLEGSISTLPLGWPTDARDDGFFEQAAAHLLRCAEHLRQLESNDGRLIRLCLEPEPGCCLQTSLDVVHFFERYLDQDGAAKSGDARRYLGVCHDVCHAAVMFEDQTRALENYAAAGIKVGKVQVSSAIEADFRDSSAKEIDSRRRQLAEFVEPRYLHQTVVQRDGQPQFYEDLPVAMAAVDDLAGTRWRTHFHVPIFLPDFDELLTTQDQIGQCLRWLKQRDQLHHLEVETYAWTVSPRTIKARSLVESVSQEMSWLERTLADL